MISRTDPVILYGETILILPKRRMMTSKEASGTYHHID